MFSLSYLLILAGIVAIVGIVLHQIGIKIPPFVVQILWVIFAVAIGLLAIRIILSL